MKTRKIQLEFGAAAILLVIIIWVVAAGYSALTNESTEKTYAWLACKSFLAIAEHVAQENRSVFEINKLNVSEQSEIQALSQSWHNGADFFINTNFTVRGPVQQIAIVSNWKLETTKPTIWNFFHKNPAHVVGYSDGMVGLILPKQFTNLNLSSFVLLSTLATNLEFNVTK